MNACIVTLGIGSLVLALSASAAAPNPFADNNGLVPLPSEYNGPLFKLSYQYPAKALVPAMPWVLS